MKSNKSVLIIIALFVLGLLYLSNLLMDNIWILFLGVIAIFLVLSLIITGIEKVFPRYNLGKNINKILKKIKNAVIEFLP